MKIYYEPTNEDIEKLKSLCQKRHWPLIPLKNRVGRPTTQPGDETTVHKVLNIYRSTGNYRETARQTGLSSGVVWRMINGKG